MKSILLFFTMLIFSGTSSAAGFMMGVDERADALEAALKGNNSYQAHLAREFASVAVEEKSQSDTCVARAFMAKAEEHAAKAGGSK